MGYLPRLNARARQQIMTSAFGGYNHNLRIADGEMYDQENMTGDLYPLLAPRKERGVVRKFAKPAGMLGKESLAVVDGEKLYYDGKVVNGVKLSTDASMYPKQLVSMGAYLCIWPDKVYVNTVDLTDCGSMGAVWETYQTVTVSMCRRDGTDYDDAEIIKSDAEPKSPENGQLWMDTSGSTHVLKQYAGTSAEWVQVATVYLKLQAKGLGKQFREWDGVTISGLEVEDETINQQLKMINTTSALYGAGDDYVIVVGLVDQSVEVKGHVTIERSIPDLDYVTESENRLWGCKYGRAGETTLNEIRACKLGDFRNWNVFLGLSTDSYTVSVGTDGPFTGAATLKSYPCFFKEGCIHRVGGSMPSSYQMITTMGRGVQEGSWKSIARVGEALIYKGRTGVLIYDGSVPYEISDALGGEMYDGAVAGSWGDKYYISMQDKKETWHLFEYDAKNNRWHKQDNLHAVAFATVRDELYAIDAETGKLLAMNGTEGTAEGDVSWSATFAPVGYEVAEQKYLSRYNIRMQMTPGSRVWMDIQYDSDGCWRPQGEMMGTNLQTFMVPVLPRRCDHCQLRIRGVGQVKIFSIAREIEIGGDGK